jgi:single stranded DNA-binding protein
MPEGISNMNGSLNKVLLIGNVGQNPEMRSMQGGNRMANFSLAISKSWRDTANPFNTAMRSPCA